MPIRSRPSPSRWPRLRERPMSCWSWQTMWALVRRRPLAGRYLRPIWTDWQRGAWSITAFIPPPCVRRRAPRCWPGATIMRWAMPWSAISPPAIPAIGPWSRAAPPRSPRCCARMATTRRCSASIITSPRRRAPSRARSINGRRDSASSNFTAS